MLSIVIPVYNVEKYVGATLESIYSQGVDEDAFEVVVVNDGTPDGSMGVVKGYADKYANLRIIEQENRGLSGARNTGLKEARGEYVWFVDSDDRLTDGALKLIFDTTANHNGRDMYGFGIFTERENDGVRKHFSPLGEWNKSKAYNRDVDYSVMGNHTFGPTARYVIRKSFLQDNNLTFTEGILHEDVDYLNRAFFYAKSIWLREEETYIYLERTGGSIMSSIRIKTFYDLMSICKSFDLIRERYKTDAKARLYWDAVIWRTITIMLNPNMRGHGLHPDDICKYEEFVRSNKAFLKKNILHGFWASLRTCAWKDALKAVAQYVGR